ncbi:MAG: glycosyltransferase family 87 protein [Candidatus Sulfotelmatobacter sp.]
MKYRVWLGLSVLVCGITLAYRSTILLPWESYVNEHYLDVAHGRLKAQLGDLYPRWVGTRELLLHGRNPYGADVSHEIQLGFYGHVVEQKFDVPGAPVIDEQRFVYPVYVVFLLAPIARLDFPVVQRWAPLFLGTLTIVSVMLWVYVLRWRPPRIAIVTIVLFVLSTPQIMQGLRLRQLGFAVAFLLALSAWCLVRNHLAIAGVFLALSTIKPQMAVLPLAWFLFWGLSGARKRWPLLAGFGIVFAVLVGLGEIVLPRWPRYFVEGLFAYRNYFPTTSLLCLVFGNIGGGVISAIAIISIFALAWRNRCKDASSPEFSLTLAASFIGATLVLPILTPYNQVLLLFPILMILRDWTSLPKIARRIFASALAWPYVCSLFLLLYRTDLDSPKRIPLLPSAVALLVPYLVLLLFLIMLTTRDSNSESRLRAAKSCAASL